MFFDSSKNTPSFPLFASVSEIAHAGTQTHLVFYLAVVRTIA